MPLLSRANTDWVTKTGKATSYDDGWVYCSCGPLDVVAFPQLLRLDVVGAGTSILQSIIYNAHLLYSVARPVQRLRNLPIISQAVSTSRDPSGIKRTCMTARACPQDLTWKRIGSWSVMLYCVMTMLPTAGIWSAFHSLFSTLYNVCTVQVYQVFSHNYFTFVALSFWFLGYTFR